MGRMPELESNQGAFINFLLTAILQGFISDRSLKGWTTAACFKAVFDVG